ncbi:hypothetical protein [Lysobacter sp. Root690]|uniref:hypothetical protein n=1 Tax=Lysobacter sp. Root690 TaxID=1736588 RepID=UPI0006F87037|nr:hypothetical protein [Lysobacter sp. Root690]KRB11327.1 hypothetical protein ASD86_02570 [Lysobacter sp. Root690]
MTATAPSTSPSSSTVADVLRADLDTALRYALAIGALLVLMLPAARGSQSAIGWLPMWLVAMPAMAWWALHRFRLPSWRRKAPDEVGQALRRRRRGAVQARRRARPAVIARSLPRAA